MKKIILLSFLFNRFSHNMTSGKTGMIQVEKGTASITTITKAKSGNLLVVSKRLYTFMN